MLILLNNKIILEKLHAINYLDYIKRKLFEIHHVFNVDLAKSANVFIYTLIFINAHYL